MKADPAGGRSRVERTRLGSILGRADVVDDAIASGDLVDHHVGYVARDAWRRAGAYFVACLAIALATGAVGQVLGDDGVARDGAWAWWATGYVAVVVAGYGILWPRGTFVEDRPAAVGVQAGFGVVWGLCQGLLFLSLYRAVGWIGLSDAPTGVLAWLVVSGFQGVWHDRYWDRRVSPPHNIPSWNPVKVVGAHVPNLTVGMVVLTAYGDARLFVGMQVLALTLSALAMRFPGPGYARR